MTYRIELERTDKRFSAYNKNEYAYGVNQVKDFIRNCVEEGYKIARIVKTTKDGKGYDVTSKYIKETAE